MSVTQLVNDQPPSITDPPEFSHFRVISVDTRDLSEKVIFDTSLSNQDQNKPFTIPITISSPSCRVSHFTTTTRYPSDTTRMCMVVFG